MFEQHHKPLYAYAYKKSNDSFLAEEIVQNTFIRYWKQKGTTEAINPEFLLFMIAKGLLIDHWRKKEIMVPTDPGVLPNEELADNAADKKYEHLHFDHLVREAAASLPERQKQIFELNYYSDMPGNEIAASLNISPKTVSNLLNTARKHVRSKVVLQFALLFGGLL